MERKDESGETRQGGKGRRGGERAQECCGRATEMRMVGGTEMGKGKEEQRSGRCDAMRCLQTHKSEGAAGDWKGGEGRKECARARDHMRRGEIRERERGVVGQRKDILNCARHEGEEEDGMKMRGMNGDMISGSRSCIRACECALHGERQVLLADAPVAQSSECHVRSEHTAHVHEMAGADAELAQPRHEAEIDREGRA